ncbi:hypothetical protein [Nocardiopsis sp. RV163]|uniref:hypothetical protein n=1 Tax=Nocardiopsis sp. RV163 TaxID=1661388 RepID=UPI00128D2C7A|nr:hypothetical protein [Nocardiopsis sp. RV163]
MPLLSRSCPLPVGRQSPPAGAHFRPHLRFARLVDDLPAKRRAAGKTHHYQAAQDLPGRSRPPGRR